MSTNPSQTLDLGDRDASPPVLWLHFHSVASRGFVLHTHQYQINQQFLELLFLTHEGLLAGEVKGMQSATEWNYAQDETQIQATTVHPHHQLRFDCDILELGQV